MLTSWIQRGLLWVVAQFVLLALLLLVPPELPGLPAWPAELRALTFPLGLLLGAIGGSIGLLGLLHLGANLTPFPHPKQDGTLITGGVYALVRHPIYSGILIAAFGWALVRAGTPPLFGAVLLALFFDRKAAHEETRLNARFPEYAAYSRRTRRLLPWIY
jgi:protein-S-isoprenylcysteine O-methyltransferase Ste14